VELMGRPSKLTPAQWTEVERRLLAGETARSLGREFGVTEAAIRQKIGKTTHLASQSSQVKETAQKLADAHTALEALPPSHRGVAIDLAEKLKNISQSLASAAELGAKTAHRLHSLANTELQKVDDANVMGSADSLKVVAGLTKMANDAAVTPINLLAANKERMQKLDGPEDDPDKPRGVLVVPGLATDSQAWAQQAQAAAKGE
jgi:hypothetical protein